MRRRTLLLVVMLCALFATAGTVRAQETQQPASSSAQEPKKRDITVGLIAAAGARIWVDNRVDFADNRNLIVAAVTLVLGAGDFTLKVGGVAFGGIATATFGAILLNLLLRERR